MPDLWQKVSAKFQVWIFTDNYSPMVNDVTFRVVVARMIIENLKAKVVDIDNAFLNGDLENEIYIMITEGYDEMINPRVDKEVCLILQKAIYGLVHAARQFWKKIVCNMQEADFKLIIGKEEAIDDAITVLQGR